MEEAPSQRTADQEIIKTTQTYPTPGAQLQAWANNHTVLFGLDFGDLQTGGIFGGYAALMGLALLMTRHLERPQSSRPPVAPLAGRVQPRA